MSYNIFNFEFSNLYILGTIAACRFSPFHRKLLLTAGMDGCIKLFDVLQQRPAHVFYPPTVEGTVSRCGLADVSWSHARPLVFAVAPEVQITI